MNPHPVDGGVVGTYVHSYDPAPRIPYPSPIPAMRPSDETQSAHRSATPIYDALYAEYRRSFRALPGDRSGEEEAEFSPFMAREHSGDWEQIGSWEPTCSRNTGGWQRQGNIPPALPPGTRDSQRHGL